MTHEVLMTLDFSAFAASSHPAVREENLELEAIRKYKWILPRASYGSALLKQIFQARGLLPPAPAIVVDDIQSVLEIVVDSDMLSFGHIPPVGDGEPPAFANVSCEKLELREDYGANFRKVATVPPICFKLLDELKDTESAGARA